MLLLQVPLGVAAWTMGALSSVPGQGPNTVRMLGMKLNTYANIARYGSHLGRGAVGVFFRSLPAIGTALGVYYGGREVAHVYWEHLRSLDWVPDLYQGPGGH